MESWRMKILTWLLVPCESSFEGCLLIETSKAEGRVERKYLFITLRCAHIHPLTPTSVRHWLNEWFVVFRVDNLWPAAQIQLTESLAMTHGCVGFQCHLAAGGPPSAAMGAHQWWVGSGTHRSGLFDLEWLILGCSWEAVYLLSSILCLPCSLAYHMYLSPQNQPFKIGICVLSVEAGFFSGIEAWTCSSQMATKMAVTFLLDLASRRGRV